MLKASVAIIAAPKSASTFLYHVLGRLLDAEPVDILPSDTANGQLIPNSGDHTKADGIPLSSRRTITRQHLLPTTATLSLLGRSDMQPVILWRDMADSVVSLCEEWERQWTDGFNKIAADGISHQFLGPVPANFIERFLAASKVARYDLTVDLAVPWYCQFIAGWHEVHRREPSWPILSHDEVVADKVATIANLLWKLGTATDRERVEVVISELSSNRDLVNLNNGGSGRGRELLTRQQLQRIERLWSAFASPDPGASERRIDEVRQTVRERTVGVVRNAMDEAAVIGNAEPEKTIALLTGAHLRLDGLLRAAPRDMELLKLLARVYGSLGRSFQQRSDGRARQYLDSAISVYARINAAEGLEHSQPWDLECTRQLASLYAESGRFLLVQGDRVEASRYFGSAAAVYDQILQQAWTAAVLEEMAQNFLLQAETYVSIGDPAYATADYRRALSILAQLYAVDPRSKEILLAHLRAYRGLADAFAILGNRNSEIDALRSTVAVLAQLEALEPGLAWKTDIEQVAKRLPQKLLARVLGAVRAVRSVVLGLLNDITNSTLRPAGPRPKSRRPERTLLR